MLKSVNLFYTNYSLNQVYSLKSYNLMIDFFYHSVFTFQHSANLGWFCLQHV